MQMRVLPVFTVLVLFAVAANAADDAHTPAGDGAPELVVCRAPQQLPGSRLTGPRVCRTNAVWAQYRRDGMDVAPDGIHDVQSEKYRSLHQGACRPASAGGSSASNAMQTNIGMICD
jgi:hypothetical protein